MAGAFGPILTTGVALSAAVVVVTNPVTAPHADVRIPAAQAEVSKASGQAIDMLDEDFIRAVGPTPAASNNPLAVLKDLVNALVADAADLGKGAIVRAFVAGASVVSRQEVPELTAASHPYLPFPFVPPAPDELPWTSLPGPVPAELRPVVEQALTAIITDVGDLTDARAVAAAFVAGAALAADESPLLESLRGLVDSRLQPALDRVGSVVSALPHAVVGDVIRDSVERYLPTIPSVIGVPVLPARDADDGEGLLASAAPAGGDGAVAPVVTRQARRIAAERPLVPVLSIGGLDSPAVDTVSLKHPRRQAASSLGSEARGPIARAIKAAVDRARD